MGAEIEPGALVGEQLGKYELLALIAVGGTAEIYLARIGGEAGFEKYVVVKCLHDHLVHESEYVDMFLDEARLGAQLDHSNIVQTLELGEHQGRYYMVMEYLSGLSIAQIGRAAYDRVPGGLVPIDIVLGLSAQASAGLHYAHERKSGGQPLNIVHRDISPQNLVVSFDGVLKLVDFGIAKAERRRTQTETGTIKGKFAYMSPEQCKAEPIDRRTDIFALGTITWELLTGRRLFKRGSTYETYQAIVNGGVPAPSSLNSKLDARVDQVVLKALAYEREARYATAEDFGDALLGLVHERGGSVSASDVAMFFDEHFTVEIEEHAAQMREVIAGKRQHAVTGSWDIREGGSDSGGGRPSSEFVEALARPERKPESAKARAAQTPTAPGLREAAKRANDDFEDNAETQIELDPMSGFDAPPSRAQTSPEGPRRESAPTKQIMLDEVAAPAAASSNPEAPKRTMVLGAQASGTGLDSRDTDEQPQASATLFRPDGAPPPARQRQHSSSRPPSVAEGSDRSSPPIPPPAPARPATAPPTPPPVPARAAGPDRTPPPSERPTTLAPATSDPTAPAPQAAAAERPTTLAPATPAPHGTPPPLEDAAPAQDAALARPQTSPTAETSQAGASWAVVSVAFAISAGVGFGATLLAGMLLG